MSVGEPMKTGEAVSGMGQDTLSVLTCLGFFLIVSHQIIQRDGRPPQTQRH